MVLTLLGAGILWFGWFGFNGGSALAANGLSAAALTASQVAAAAAALSWIVIEWLHRGKPTALGMASGLVAGLVAVTPASGFVTPLGALAIGLIAGLVCYASVTLKPFFKYDDSLDAFGVHGVGGFLGAVLTGVFFSAALFKAGSGSDLPAVNFFGNTQVPRVVIQLVAASVAAGYAFVVSIVLIKVIDLLVGFTLDPKSENEGLDRSEHGEVGFDLGLALEAVPEHPAREPRAAMIPPNGKRHFSVVVDGAQPRDLMKVWSGMCQVGQKPPPSEFQGSVPEHNDRSGQSLPFSWRRSGRHAREDATALSGLHRGRRRQDARRGLADSLLNWQTMEEYGKELPLFAFLFSFSVVSAYSREPRERSLGSQLNADTTLLHLLQRDWA